MTVHRDIYELESQGMFKEAAELLILERFYQVSRNIGLLCKLPPHKTPQMAMEAVADEVGWLWGFLSRLLNDSKRQPVSKKRIAHHYLTYFAPPKDRIIVQEKTFDAYRLLGGGPFPGTEAGMDSWGKAPWKTTVPCEICGLPASSLWPEHCESCHAITNRFGQFLGHKNGRKYVLRQLGIFGLEEIAQLLEGIEDEKRAEASAAGSLAEG